MEGGKVTDCRPLNIDTPLDTPAALLVLLESVLADVGDGAMLISGDTG